eukprot:m.179467 g.179467  ORF g.179467 m.179467 type:complete len:411 (-) comp17409_c0_seq3:1869-3101(-)
MMSLAAARSAAAVAVAVTRHRAVAVCVRGASARVVATVNSVPGQRPYHTTSPLYNAPNELVLIDDSGAKLGIVTREYAEKLAASKKHTLHAVRPEASPPIYRLFAPGKVPRPKAQTPSSPQQTIAAPPSASRGGGGGGAGANRSAPPQQQQQKGKSASGAPSPTPTPTQPASSNPLAMMSPNGDDDDSDADADDSDKETSAPAATRPTNTPADGTKAAAGGVKPWGAVAQGSGRQQQQQQEAKAKPKDNTREIQMTGWVQQHDLLVKVKKIREFLLKQHEVRVVVKHKKGQSRAAELQHETLQHTIQLVRDIGTQKGSVKSSGNMGLSCTLAPFNAKKQKQQLTDNFENYPKLSPTSPEAAEMVSAVKAQAARVDAATKEHGAASREVADAQRGLLELQARYKVMTGKAL